MEKEKLKTVSIKGKEYVTVNERIRYFNDAYKNGAIITQIMSQENDTVLIKAKVIPDVEQQERYFTGYAQEIKGKGMVNSTSYIENCETSAVGRALGFMGIGVETSIASAEEVSNAISRQNQSVEQGTISKEQISKIRNGLVDLGGDVMAKETKLLKYLKAESIEGIAKADYQKAIAAIEATPKAEKKAPAKKQPKETKDSLQDTRAEVIKEGEKKGYQPGDTIEKIEKKFNQGYWEMEQEVLLDALNLLREGAL